MGIVVNKRPEQTINGQPSHWSSSNNPILFEFTATDLIGKENYYVQIEVYEVGSDVLLSRKNYRPFSDGNFKVDVSGQLISYLKPENGFQYDVPNRKEQLAQVKYYLAWEEFWDAGNIPQVVDVNEYTAHNSALQLGFFDDQESVGPNLRDYTPFPVEVPEQNKMKFLTGFEKPSFWPGYPFDISWLYTENIANFDVRRVENRKNVNGADLGTFDNQLLSTEINHQNRMQISGGYPSNVKEIDLAIHLGAAIPDNYVYPGYVEEGYTEIL